jgi:hypothetical protein
MLTIRAKIEFYSDKLSHNLSTQNELRPGFNFGNNFIFSGTIIADKDVDEIIRGNEYEVTVEFPTIEKEAYSAIKYLISFGILIQIQNASKIIGKGEILDFKYVSLD